MSFSASSKTFNREDIPVGVGIRKPLFSKEDIGPINQAAVLHGKEDLSLSLKQNAVDLIISRVRSCRNLIIVSIGPLTNVATVLVKEPNLARKSKLVMMGGVINSQQAEYNVSRDPEAARVVFESSMEVLMVGLDVTMKCQLRRQELDNLANKDLSSTELLMDMVRAWQESTGRTYPVLHDPLAVALAFDRALVKTESRKVNVETRGEFTRGFTIASKSKTPNAQVCLHVDATRFADLFMRILCSK